MKESLKTLAGSTKFQKLVSVMIILCAVVMGVDTMYYGQDFLLLRIIDDFFILFFAFEIIVRILAENKISDFFKLVEIRKKVRKVDHRPHAGPIVPEVQEVRSIHVTEQGFWNWFDFSIVTVGVISMFSYIFVHPEFLIISRLFRVMRVLRLLDMSESLKAVERKIISIIPTIFSFGLLLAILLYIYSIIGIYIFGPVNFGRANFTTIGTAFMSLFQVMTLDGWSDLMDAVAAQSQIPWLAKSYFISFVILTAIVSFNVFVAVLTSQVYDQITTGKEEAEQDPGSASLSAVMEELRRIRQELEEIKKSGKTPD